MENEFDIVAGIFHNSRKIYDTFPRMTTNQLRKFLIVESNSNVVQSSYLLATDKSTTTQDMDTLKHIYDAKSKISLYKRRNNYKKANKIKSQLDMYLNSLQ